MATVSLAIAQTGKVRYNLTRRRPGARTGLRDNAQSRCQVGGPGSEGRPPPPRGRACQPQPPPAPPAPLSAPKAAPSRPQGVRALRGRARGRVGEELGGSGRAAKLRGGSRSAPAEERLGDPRWNRCTASAPERAGASPLGRASTARGLGASGYRVLTAPRESAAKRMGGPREGRGGARPATSNPERAPSATEKSDLGPGRVRSQAGELGPGIGEGGSAGKRALPRT